MDLSIFIDRISEHIITKERGLLSRIKDDKKWDKDNSSELEIAVAEAFISNYFRMGTDGDPVAFDGRIYSKVNRPSCEMICSEVCRILDLRGRYKTDTSERFYRTLMRRLENIPYRPTRNFITFNNCVLDTETMNVHDFTPDIQSCIRIDTDYDLEVVSAPWQKFLDDVLPDPDMQKTLQEFIGCAFIDRSKIKMERICYLLGGGSNGKSVLFDAVFNALGRDNVSTLEMSDLVSDKSTAEYNVDMINGKLLNFSSEMGQKDISGGKYKKFVSGEPMVARCPYGKPYRATLIPPFIANLNKMPSVSDQTYGHFRRSIVIPFNRTFKESEQDKTLPFKLAKENVGILNWIIEGTCRFLKQNGNFTDSSAISAMTEKSRIESNSVLSFLYDRGYNKEGDIEEPAINDKDLYAQYTSYCIDSGLKPFSKRRMVDVMKGEGYSVSSGWNETRNRCFQIILRRKYSESEQILQEAENIADCPF